MNKYIAKQIILAQIASDGGKGINEIKRCIQLGNVYFKKGYSVKDFCIVKAIKAICKDKNSGFTFHVKKDYYSTYMEKHAYLVYFNFKIEGKKHQISFHTFRNLENYLNPKTSTRWSKKLSSRVTAFRLAQYIDLLII